MRDTGPQQHHRYETTLITTRGDTDAVYVSDIQSDPASLATSVQAHTSITYPSADKSIALLFFFRALCTA
jgi:hypothetical protein